MQIQHAAQAAGGLPTDNPGRMQAKYVIVDEVERLRWRIWNGKAKNGRRSIDRVRKVMRVYKDAARGHRYSVRFRDERPGAVTAPPHPFQFDYW